MEYIEMAIKGVWLLRPQVHSDSRGYFMEAWKQDEFTEHIGQVAFVQDNESQSTYGVLRGLHYQRGEYAQAKLVRVLRGAVRDVAVDLRQDSATFGKYVMADLTSDNHHQLFIPRGCAHGFLVLSNEALFVYKVDNIYAPWAESAIRWNDKDIAINWQFDITKIHTSDKDNTAPTLREALLP